MTGRKSPPSRRAALRLASALIPLALLAAPGPVALSATQPAAPAGTTPTGTAPAADPSTSAYPVFSPQLEWPLAAFQASQLWRYSLGAGVSVAVVDTGIDRAQPDLAGAIAQAVDLTARQPRDDGADQSDDSHGTAVGGIIAARGSAVGGEHMVGLAPRARLFDIRVAVQPGQVSPDAVAEGIAAAVRAGAAVINVSLIVPAESQNLSQAVSYAQARHSLIVAAAGSGSAPQALARYPGVVTVAAVNQAGQAIAPAGTNFPVTVSAPGAGLFSTGETAGPDAAARGYVHDASGSALSAAFVTAAVALLVSADPKLAPAAAARLLVKTARQAAGAGGSGPLVIDPLAALDSLLSPHSLPHPPVPRPRVGSGFSVAAVAAVGAAGVVGVILVVILARVLIVRRRHAARLALDAIPSSSWDQPW